MVRVHPAWHLMEDHGSLCWVYDPANQARLDDDVLEAAQALSWETQRTAGAVISEWRAAP